MTRPASRATLYFHLESTVSLALTGQSLVCDSLNTHPSVNGDEGVHHGQAPLDPLTIDESTATLRDRQPDTRSEPASRRPPGRRPRASAAGHGPHAAQAQRPVAQTRRPLSIRVLSRRRVLLDRDRAQ